MNTLRNVGSLIGRILMAIIFLVSGSGKFANPAATAATMVHHHMPAVLFFLFAAAVVEVGSGILLVIGLETRWVALVLFLFLIPVTIIFHLIPAITSPSMAVRANMQSHFLKNLAIMGGLLIVATQGGGGFSVDRALSSAPAPAPARTQTA